MPVLTNNLNNVTKPATTEITAKPVQEMCYLIPRPEDRQWGLVITTAGRSHIGLGSPYPPLRHPQAYNLNWQNGRVLHDYALIYITRGQGKFETKASGEHVIQAGHLFLLFPGIWHRYAPDPATGWNEYWVGFQGELADRLIAPPFFYPERPVIDLGAKDTLLNSYLDLLAVARENPPDGQPVMASLVFQMLAGINTHQRKDRGDHPHVPPEITRAKALLHERHADPLDLGRLAKELGVSYTSFRRSFKRHTGLPPNQYLQQIRLDHAKHRLIHTPQTISEIAYATGFASIYYFSRLFKSRFGKGPGQFRKGE
jgi:AraC-like DNA-binding protein